MGGQLDELLASLAARRHVYLHFLLFIVFCPLHDDK